MLSEKDLDHVISLAHLEINQEEKAVFAKQLTNIFDYMAVLNNIDLAKYPPSVHSDSQDTPLREDIVKEYEGLNLQENAPDLENYCFAVPKILEE